MRVAAGVLLLMIGLWSVGEGGCSTTGAILSQHARGVTSTLLHAAEQAGQPVDPLSQERADRAGRMASFRLIYGAAILVGGILCVVAGVLFFVNKGRAFGFVAPGVGIIGEILYFALDTFAILGLVKVLIYGFAMFAATKIGAETQV